MDSSDSELDFDTVRKTYLITYSQADFKRFPSHQEAQRIVVKGPLNILTYGFPRSFLSSDRISC